MHLHTHPLPASSVVPPHTLHTDQKTESQKESSLSGRPELGSLLPNVAAWPGLASLLPARTGQAADASHALGSPQRLQHTVKAVKQCPCQVFTRIQGLTAQCQTPLKTIAPGPAGPSRAHRLCSATYRQKPPPPITGRASEGGCPSLGPTPGILHLQVHQPLAQGPGEEARWAGAGRQAGRTQGRFRGLPVSCPLAARVAGSTGSSYQIRPGPQCLDRLKLLQSGGRPAAGSPLPPRARSQLALQSAVPEVQGAPPQEARGDWSASPGEASVEHLWKAPFGI